MEFTEQEKQAFSKMAKKRWDNKTPEQKSKEMKRIRRMGIEKQKEMKAKLASISTNNL